MPAGSNAPATRPQPVFLDAVSVDVERAQRVNRTLQLIPREAQKDATFAPD